MTNAHNHNLQADTTTINKHRSITDPLKPSKEAEHRQKNSLHTSKCIPMTNLHISKAGLRQATRVDTKTNNVNAMNGDAEKKRKEQTNYMKKKVVVEQNIRKRRKKENAKKSADAKCKDVPTV
jgi:hypothetical protein